MYYLNLFIFFLITFLSFNVFADQSASKDNSSRDPAYPGEEIKTDSGKVVRRWSTKGAVEVSPPPRPFDDYSQQRAPGGLLLNIDSFGNLNRSDSGTYGKPNRRPYRMKEGSIK